MAAEKVNIFWFRRDLRLNDNTALSAALKEGLPVIPLFIFDTDITGELNPSDPRLSFIYDSLKIINDELRKKGSSILMRKGEPLKILEELSASIPVSSVFINRDYEPYARQCDEEVKLMLERRGITLYSFSDQVIFEEKEVVKADGLPYTVFTPYRNAWMKKYKLELSVAQKTGLKGKFMQTDYRFPSLAELRFERSSIRVRPYDLSCITDYDKFRDIPSADRTTYLGPHLRFGTVSIREITEIGARLNKTFLDELIWREFFMQLMASFPRVVTENFRSKYDFVPWRNDDREFEKWCSGETGYPMVDAGMRQLIETGYMHNRVRMIVAGFLCKHLLTDWRRGEAWFAEKLNDYELSSNNGNWQWAAGTGVDASQYFRIFNPVFQQKKFDPKDEYVKRWIPGYGKKSYLDPIVDHNEARERVFSAYKSSLTH